jgi:hypothetical protein
MRRFLIVLTFLLSGTAYAAAPDARGTISIEPQALEHYSYCISQAKDRLSIFNFDRAVMFRCHGDIAASYWNYLGRKRVRDYVVDEVSGVFVYRTVSGVGRCWNKIVDASGEPVSLYGCDIYVEL